MKIRYGVIDLDDMLRDLEHWETLLTSSFMQRPHETLIQGGPEIEELQKLNLTSAVSHSLLSANLCLIVTLIE